MTDQTANASDIRTLHVVTAGEYDEFRYLFAYDNPDDAQRAVEQGHGDDVHELRLIPAGTLPQKVRVYSAGTDSEGNLSVVDDEKYPWEAPQQAEFEKGILGWFVWGTDRDAVVALAQQHLDDGAPTEKE